jgi:hypothetical protein
MNEGDLIEIPKDMYMTLFRDHYFSMYREMFYSCENSMERTFYDLEDKRENVGLPPAYLTFESFKKAYYKWSKDKLSGKGRNSLYISDERYILR